MTKPNPFVEFVQRPLVPKSRLDWIKNDKGQLETCNCGDTTIVFKTNFAHEEQYRVATQD